MEDWKEVEDSLISRKKKIVRSGFVTLEGFTLAYSFLGKEETPFKRSIWTPIYYIFKANEKNPLQIIDTEGFLSIYPENELNAEKPRMPAEVFRDKKVYNLSAFMLVPFDVVFDDFVTGWDKYLIKESFFPNEDGSLQDTFMNVASDISLLYCNHGLNIHIQDHLYNLLELENINEVNDEFFSWLKGVKEIYSHEKTFDKKLEGKILISLERIPDLQKDIGNLLKDRYDYN